MKISTIVSLVLFCRSVYAANCPSGYFCAWTEANYQGQRAAWAGDDILWEGFIAGGDSSWANHAISGPGIKDHVAIYSGQGSITLCLAPGQEVAYNGAANGLGNSHVWVKEC